MSGGIGISWRRELRSRGHDSVAPDLPNDDDSASLDDYAETVVGDRQNLVVVGQSYGAFTAGLAPDPS